MREIQRRVENVRDRDGCRQGPVTLHFGLLSECLQLPEK
jgi:hypothetical protein